MLHAHPRESISHLISGCSRADGAHLEKTAPPHAGIELARNIRRGMNMGVTSLVVRETALPQADAPPKPERLRRTGRPARLKGIDRQEETMATAEQVVRVAAIGDVHCTKTP